MLSRVPTYQWIVYQSLQLGAVKRQFSLKFLCIEIMLLSAYHTKCGGISSALVQHQFRIHSASHSNIPIFPTHMHVTWHWCKWGINIGEAKYQSFQQNHIYHRNQSIVKNSQVLLINAQAAFYQYIFGGQQPQVPVFHSRESQKGDIVRQNHSSTWYEHII